MKINVLSAGKWFRYIGQNAVSFEGSTSKLVFKGRQVFALVPNKNKFFLFTKEMDQRAVIDAGQAEILVNSSKPFLGKIEGSDIEPGSETLQDSFPEMVPKTPTASSVEEDKEPETKPEIEISKPKVRGASPIAFEVVDSPVLTSFGKIFPPTSSILKLYEKALPMVGCKVKFKTPIQFGVSNDMGSCIIQRFLPNRGLYEVTIVINPGQLVRLNGSLTPQFVAQVLTHELGHHVVKHILKNSEIMRWKKEIAAKKLHKDQFNHPGYSNPWWDEAFAILVESMVHGRSARGFSTPIGWEIAQKYFSNVYLKNGEYTGSYDSM